MFIELILILLSGLGIYTLLSAPPTLDSEAKAGPDSLKAGSRSLAEGDSRHPGDILTREGYACPEQPRLG